jgi:bifunctional UDP-N-acetylglucosamine pyrophosphorylase/glucosamine-1-phosphate N-acetyltransferase
LDGKGDVKKVVEACEVDELNPMMTNLCNAGMLLADRKFLIGFLDEKCKGINSKSFHKELYLTDVFDKGRSGYIKIDEEEAVGVNNRTELSTAEGIFQKRLRDKMMKKGVTLIAPETVFFAADTIINHDTIIHPYVNLGPGVEIDYGCEIKSFCDIDGAKIGKGSVVGPFARIRPNSQIENNCKIGNFVEVKNAYFGPGVKASHLAYLGDVHIGPNSNIGAGVIICNYDGVNKHHTTIGAEVNIGANASIISPRYIGDASKIGAGSVITEDVMDGHTAIARAPQVMKRRKNKVPS